MIYMQLSYEFQFSLITKSRSCYIKYKNQTFELKYDLLQVAAWAGALSGVVISVSAAAYGYVLYNPNKPYNAIENGLYAGIHHHAVAAGFMIIVIVQIISGFGK